MPIPRPFSGAYHRLTPAEQAWRDYSMWMSPETPANSPYFRKDLAGGDGVISLSDIEGPPKPPTYSPIIDRKALSRSDQAAQRGVQEAKAKKGVLARVEGALGNIFAPSHTSRGLTNNNPGNIEYGKTAKSYGAIGAEPKGRFAVFNSPEEGISSIYRLQNQYERNGYQTIAQRVNKWAPPSENNSKAYIKRVADAMGIDANTPFSIRDQTLGPAFVTALIQHENGTQPYSTQQIDDARHLIDVPSLPDQARELQAQQARVGRPSLGPPSPTGGSAVAGIFNGPPKSNAPDFDKMSPEELDSFIESKKTAILGTVANNPQLALDPHFADELDKTGIVPKSAPQTAQRPQNPLQPPMQMGVKSAGPTGFIEAGIPSMSQAQYDAAMRGPQPSMVRPQGPPGSFPPASPAQVAGRPPTPPMTGFPAAPPAQTTIAGRPPTPGPTGLPAAPPSVSAAVGPQMPQPSATVQMPGFNSPFSPDALMSAPLDQRMAVGEQQKPLAAPPVSLGPVNATAPGPPPGVSQEARGPVPIGVGPMSVSATAGQPPPMPSASIGQLPPMPQAATGNPPLAAPKGNLQTGPFPPMMTSPGINVGPPKSVQSVSFPLAPGEPVPMGIGNIPPTQPYGFSPPAAPAPPGPPVLPSLLEDRATRERRPIMPAAIAPPMPAPLAPTAIRAPQPPPMPIPSILPRLLSPPKKLSPENRQRLMQLLNGTGMPFGNNAGWNGGTGGYGGMTGGWGGLGGNGTGMGGGGIGYGTGGGYNPNK